MKKVKVEPKAEEAILYARGMDTENMEYIKSEMKRLGYSSQGEYLNALFKAMRPRKKTG